MRVLFGIVAALVSASVAVAQAPPVVTDITAVHSLASRVMYGVGTPKLIIQHGATAHGYAIRPSEASALEQAKLVFQIGAGMTPWLDHALENLAVDANIIELMETDGTIQLAWRERAKFTVTTDDDKATHDSSDHSAATELEINSEQEHDHHNTIDPHGWLDPYNGQVWLDVMATELARIDPANAVTYQQNAKIGKAEIEAATTTIEALLTPIQNHKFIVFHDAYQYFENRFGLPVVGAIAVSNATNPSPARIAEIQATAIRLGITCVFAEPQFNAGLVTTVVEGSRATAAVIDPMGSGLEPGPTFYTELLENIASQIAGCKEG
jgi:zinc transport system substrate-binding protein